MSTIKNLQNKKIVILGLGLENIALVKYLLKHKIKCEITVCDKRDDINKKWIPASAGMTGARIRWQVGKGYNRRQGGAGKNLEKFDVLFRAPGWPIKSPQPPLIKGVLTSAMKLFFELCPSRNIIGVTGTKGKGTTASLIYEILRAAGKRVWLGGNIGVAPFEFMDKIKNTDWVVLELSSFQLEDMTVSPHIAVITNFYSEHLAPADPNNPNYHKSLKDYRDAKLNIIKWQRSGDMAVLNYELRITNYGLKSKIYTFSAKNQKANCFWLDENKIKCNINSHDSLFIIHTSLLGEHNKENIAAAVEVAKILGVKPEIIKIAVVKFKGLEHRLEFVKEIKGAKYYDDSFATTPESTIIALRSFNQPAVISTPHFAGEKSLKDESEKYKGFLPAVEMTNKRIIVLLGGADKAADFKDLAEEVKRRCKFVVLLKGEATPRIKKELLKVKFAETKIKLVNNIKEAVSVAHQQADHGDVVLLSTACASFGMFKNYKERGDLFKKQVKSLP